MSDSMELLVLSAMVCRCLAFLSDADLEPSSSRLTVSSDVMEIMHAMSAPDSGLEIRDRMWLKITIPNAFIGK